MPYTREEVERFRQSLADERYDRCMSQKELAEAIGVSQSHISYVERGERALTVERYIQIKEYFERCDNA